MHLRWEKGLMKREKRPNGNWRVGGENYKEKMVDRVKGGGALFHFAEKLTWKFTLNFLTVFAAEKIMYFIQLYSRKIHIA